MLLGVIRSEETGILWSADYEWLIVPAANIEVSGNTITGDGWSLTLNEGYSVEKDEEGNYQLISNIN